MISLIHEFSKGIPRLINILCDFALLTSFVEGAKTVTLEVMQEVAKDLKANNYWNEKADGASVQGLKGTGVSDISNSGDIPLRLIKLEEIIKSTLQEIIYLKEKIVVLEDNVSRSSNEQNKNKVAELIERISILERECSCLIEKDKDNNPQIENKNIKELNELADQIDVLKGIFSHLNNRIKNQ